MHYILPVATTLMALSACAPGAAIPSNNDVSPTSVGTAQLKSPQGAHLGTFELEVDGNQLTGNLTVDMEPGEVHAWHLHSVGRCDAPEFTSAGGHLNPEGKSHGKLSPYGKHLGDLPNMIIGSDGRGELSVVISENAPIALSQIFDADGAAVMLHQSADDYRSDPAGAAGRRIACGVLIPHSAR